MKFRDILVASFLVQDSISFTQGLLSHFFHVLFRLFLTVPIACWWDLQYYEIFSKQAEVGFDKDIHGWLRGFLDLLGTERASKMLAGAGKFNYSYR